MRILILTYGTRGDVQPYVALGKGLKDKGHDVTVATSTRFADFIGRHGLEYGHMSDDMLALLDTDRGRDMLENSGGAPGTFMRALTMMKQVGPMQRALLADSWAAAQASRPDLIVFHPKGYGGPHIAEKLGIPAVMALPIPMIVPTALYPNMGFPKLNLGGWYNKKTYTLVNSLMALSAGKHVRALRETLGLPRQKRFDILHMTDGTPIPALHAVSKHVIPPPPDWPDTAKTTGYWFLDRDTAWTAPPELTVFLKAGPPPVYVGFGSMAGRDPRRLADAVVKALVQTGQRGIIATGWGGLETEALPDTILQISEAPHDWLFPRTAAIVHHGGAGTTAAALRAGKPSVVVPFFGDQPFWGARVHALGAGSKPIPRKKLTPDSLAAALLQVTTDPEIAANADALGQKIRAEDGIGTTIAIIESYAR